MNIEISTKEYRILLDILHIADAIMSGHRREEDKRTELHRALIQKLYALAQGEGLDRLISYDGTLNKYITTPDFEHTTPAHAVIDEFGDHIFWDQLINRLSVRDAAQIAGGPGRLTAMSDHDREHLEEPIRQRYMEEFASNGVANLTVIEQFGTGQGMPVKMSD